MLSIINFGAFLVQLANMAGKGGDVVNAAEKAVGVAGKAYNAFNTSSLSQSAGKVTIAPMVAVERDLIHMDYMQDLMTVVMLRDIRDALTHIAMQGEVEGIKISTLVDSLQPRRTGGFLSLQGVESLAQSQLISGNEAAPQGKSANFGSKDVVDLTSNAALAVGRTVMAQTQLGGTCVTFPLNFKEVPVPLSSNDLKAIFEAARPQEGWFGRVMMKNANEITRPEFLTGTDIIKREFNIRTNDLSGYYQEAMDRQSKNRSAALATGTMSMNTMANTIIMSSETARQIEAENGFRFNKGGIDRIRKAVLANTIVIVNDGEGLFTFWNSGSNMPEEYTLRNITATAKKDTSLDLQSLMKLFGGR